MGSKANLVITEKNGVCSIKVSGRANFECGIPLRSFSKNFGDNIKKIVIDLYGDFNYAFAENQEDEYSVGAVEYFHFCACAFARAGGGEDV